MQITEGLEVPEHKVGIILGKNGTGKTRLLKQIEKEYKDAVYVDCLTLPEPRLQSLMKMKPEILLLDNPEGLILDIDRLKEFAKWVHKNVKKLTLIATQSSDIYVYVLEENPKNTFFILTNGKKYMLMNGEEAIDRIDYEDLRETAKKL